MKVYIVLFLCTLKYCGTHGADSSTGVSTTTPSDVASINYEEPSSTQQTTILDSTDELTSTTMYTESTLASTESFLSSSPSESSSSSTTPKIHYKPRLLTVDITTTVSSTAVTTAETTEILTTNSEDVMSTERPDIQCANPPQPTLTFQDLVIYVDTTVYTPACEFAYLNITCNNGTNTVHKVVNTSYLDIKNIDYGFQHKLIYECRASIITTEGVSSPESDTLLMPPGTGDITVDYQDGVIRWNAPFWNVTLGYNIVITRLAPNHYVPKKCNSNVTITKLILSTSYVFTEGEADYNYNVIVSVEFWEISVKNTLNFTTLPAAPGAPTAISVNRASYDENLYSMEWSVPCDSNGIIQEFNVLLDNSKYAVIKVDKTMKDSYQTYLKALKQNTVYNLTIYAVGENNLPGAAANYILTTDDGIPDAPVPSISNIGPTYFNISWPEIDSTIAKVTNYTVNITVIGSAYDKNESCLNPDIVLPFNTTTPSFTFTEAWPSYSYTIMIVAFSNISAGKPGLIDVTTNASEPEAPYDLELHFSAISKDNHIPGYIEWKEPCKINGVMKYYHLLISKMYTEDPDNTPSPVTDEYTNVTNYLTHFEPSHLYIAQVSIVLSNNLVGEWSSTNVTTPVGYGGSPNVTVVNITNSNFIVMWNKPIEKTGPINTYDINITSVSSTQPPPRCVNRYLEKHSVLNSTTYSYYVEVKPYTEYKIILKAATERGYGNATTTYTITKEAEPENITDIVAIINNYVNDEYNATVMIAFSPPCYVNGDFQLFSLNCTGIGNGSPDMWSVTSTHYNIYESNSFTCPLRPEYSYSCTITTFNTVYSSTVVVPTFTSPAGAPNFAIDVADSIPITHNSPEEVQILLKKSMFNYSQGMIRYFALILSPSNVATSHIEEWISTSWPRVYEGSRQLTPNYWNPFEGVEEYLFTIGSGSFENPGLKADTTYFLTLRIFTKTFFRDSDSIIFKTDKASRLGMIIGLIVALLIFATLGVAAFFTWKKGLYRKFRDMYPKKSSPKPMVTSSTTAVPLKKFIQYVKNSENKPELLKEQYSLLKEKSEEIHANNEMTFAGLVENKRKNRYTNISPYDATRVKLRIDEDDEIGSDYINASYVKGYSGRIEYIATQGPLPNTCRDFWRMVLQENVTIIAMVSNFVENNKQKCHKYFPENHENLIVGDNMEIRCATELHFGTYLIRNLQIRKDCLQTTVIHMQFLKWPDFGVPTGTEHMLQFCYQLRERARMEGGLIIVHCSAGVGRTGTLIAADMLLQTANAGRALDIFRTVLQLRQQRINMVQTADQYIYLHRLIADHIDRPPSPDNTEISDPVYENMDIIRKPTISDYKLKEEESQF